MTQNFSRRAIIGGIGAALSTAAMLPAKGDTRSLFVGKSVRLVTEYPAGSGPDLVGRLIAPRLSEMLGGNFVVEPRQGAGGRIARAPSLCSRALRLRLATESDRPSFSAARVMLDSSTV